MQNESPVRLLTPTAIDFAGLASGRLLKPLQGALGTWLLDGLPLGVERPGTDLLAPDRDGPGRFARLTPVERRCHRDHSRIKHESHPAARPITPVERRRHQDHSRIEHGSLPPAR
jgi:hypothetical protein